MSELATIDTRNVGRALIVADALAQEDEQRRLLGEYVARHMQEDTDYGVIPGTKNKTLLKPGAEKLTSLFRCVPQFVIEEKIENWETGLFFYRFSCHIVTLDGGNAVAEGVGSCSSYESRYRWRNADRACPECGKAAIKRSKFPPRNAPHEPPGWYCFDKAGGCGANFPHDADVIVSQVTGRVQNPDLADCANTVLKIAKKRSHVDASIALARCSDIFTQDMEDFQTHEVEQPRQAAPRPAANGYAECPKGMRTEPSAEPDPLAPWAKWLNDEPDMPMMNAKLAEFWPIPKGPFRANVWGMLKEYATDHRWEYDPSGKFVPMHASNPDADDTPF